MNKNKICISIIFDEYYIEPALITAYELFKSGTNFPIFLIFIEPLNRPDSNEIEDILNAFKISIQSNLINIIKVNNILKDFNKFHFTNSIIYKVLAPSFIDDYDFILNIDAGILLGNKSSDFFNTIESELNNHSQKNTIISAYCTESKIDLNINLHHFPHNSKYPSGIIILFNVINYKENNTADKILFNWNQIGNNLTYAEQDLLCLTLKDDQLAQLPLIDLVIIEFLGLQGLENNLSSIGNQFEEFAFYKVCGTCKPWKYWVLDFRKSFYLKRRQNLEVFFGISQYKIIIKNRHQITHYGLAEHFLEKFETILINQ